MNITPHRITRTLTLARLRAGLTQQDLADRLGVTRQALAQWEASGGSLHLHTLVRWATALGYRLDLAAPLDTDHVRILLAADGSPACPDASMHVLVTGMNRLPVMQALAAEYPGCPVRSVGLPLGRELTTAEFGAVQGELSQKGRLDPREPEVLAVDLDGIGSLEGADLPTVIDCLSRARSARVAMVVGVDDVNAVPAQLLANIGLVLTAHADGTVTTNLPGAVTWHLS